MENSSPNYLIIRRMVYLSHRDGFPMLSVQVHVMHATQDLR